MKWLLVIGLILAVGQALSQNSLCRTKSKKLNEFKLFKKIFNKSYINKVEEVYRKKIFKYNKKLVTKHNSRFQQGKETYKMELNRFSDMLLTEVSNKYKGFKKESNSNSTTLTYIPPANVFLAEEVDWRKEGAVTPVKDQGQCGSCWAFSSTGVLEGQNFRKTGKLVSLSEQNLVDCPGTEYKTHGCFGGSMDEAFRFIKDNHGIDREESYPYEAQDKSCRFKHNSVGATVSGFVNIPTGDEDALMKAVATLGPVAVAIDAGHPGFLSYSKGVFYEPYCDTLYLDHAVLVVGYGIENGQKYWLVKNSWGKNWGDEGYIKMARDRNNNCGIASMASYPLV